MNFKITKISISQEKSEQSQQAIERIIEKLLLDQLDLEPLTIGTILNSYEE